MSSLHKCLYKEFHMSYMISDHPINIHACKEHLQYLLLESDTILHINTKYLLFSGIELLCNRREKHTLLD